MEGTDRRILTHHSTKTLHLLGMEEIFNPQLASFHKVLFSKEAKKKKKKKSSRHHHQGNISIKLLSKMNFKDLHHC